MVTLPSVPRTVRVDFHESFQSNANIQNRLFFQYVGALSQADAQTWVNSMAAAWVARILPNQVTAVSLISTVLTDLTSVTAPQATSLTTGSGAVALAGLQAADVALIIKRRVGRRYRGGHSRIYLVGCSNTQLATAETWAAAFQTTIGTAFNNLISDILTAVPVAAAPATEVNVSYFQGFTNPPALPGKRQRSQPTLRPAPLIDLVLSHSVNPHVGSQRRRNLQSP